MRIGRIVFMKYLSFRYFAMEIKYTIELIAKWWYIVLFVAYCIYQLGIWAKRRQDFKKWGCKPIKNNESTFLGISTILQLLKVRKEGFLPDFQKETYERINAHTMSSWILNNRVIATKNSENIKAMVSTQHDEFSIGRRHEIFKPLLGNGIFASEGERWKHSRAMLRPQFAREQVSHIQTFEPHIQAFVKNIHQCKGEKFNIQELFHKLTMDIATDFLFGESLGLLQDSILGFKKDSIDIECKHEFSEAFTISQNYITFRLIAQDLYFLVNSKKFRNANATIHKFTQHYVNKALQTSQQEIESKTKNSYIILYELVKQTRDPKVLQDELLSIMLAGRNTTASLLSFVFFELARRPDVWDKLKNEIYERFGKGEGNLEDITFESMKRCTYLKWVINETLRLYPSVPQNFRVSKKDTTLPRGGGSDGNWPIFIPKNQMVLYNIYSTQRLTEYYGEDADEFRPERWDDLRNIGWAYMPFSSGPRVCLGQQFALTEASYIIIRIVQMLPNIESHDPKYPPKKSTNATMRHMDGVFVSFSP